jgi:catechol 2,3-dioxygenase-like lactoylglutathione lyase family enzyme
MSWTIHHVNLPTPNLSASLHFYEKVLGLGMRNQAPDFGSDYHGPPTLGWIVSEQGPQIHLSVPNPNFAQTHNFHVNPTLKGHVAITVDDLELVYDNLRENGIYCTPVQPFAIRGHMQMYTTDPCGNTLEFNQRA